MSASRAAASSAPAGSIARRVREESDRRRRRRPNAATRNDSESQSLRTAGLVVAASARSCCSCCPDVAGDFTVHALASRVSTRRRLHSPRWAFPISAPGNVGCLHRAGSVGWRGPDAVEACRRGRSGGCSPSCLAANLDGTKRRRTSSTTTCAGMISCTVRKPRAPRAHGLRRAPPSCRRTARRQSPARHQRSGAARDEQLTTTPERREESGAAASPARHGVRGDISSSGWGWTVERRYFCALTRCSIPPRSSRPDEHCTSFAAFVSGACRPR